MNVKSHLILYEKIHFNKYEILHLLETLKRDFIIGWYLFLADSQRIMDYTYNREQTKMIVV